MFASLMPYRGEQPLPTDPVQLANYLEVQATNAFREAIYSAHPASDYTRRVFDFFREKIRLSSRTPEVRQDIARQAREVMVTIVALTPAAQRALGARERRYSSSGYNDDMAEIVADAVAASPVLARIEAEIAAFQEQAAAAQAAALEAQAAEHREAAPGATVAAWRHRGLDPQLGRDGKSLTMPRHHAAKLTDQERAALDLDGLRERIVQLLKDEAARTALVGI